MSYHRKFRVWLKEENMMVYPEQEMGLYARKKLIVLPNISTAGGSLVLTQEGNLEFQIWHSFNQRWDIAVNSAYIMLSIGKEDEDDKVIYEDDIVTGIISKQPENVCQGLKMYNMMGKEVAGVIKYSRIYAQYYFTTDGITYLDLFHGLSNIKVIGNLHETPELLK